MNSLAFNPDCSKIEEWKDIYLSDIQIQEFEDILDKAVMYIQVIDGQTQKDVSRSSSLEEELISHEGSIEEWTQQIRHARKSFLIEYEESIGRYSKGQSMSTDNFNKIDPTSLIAVAFNRVLLQRRIAVCRQHLQQLKNQSIKVYNRFLCEQCSLLQEFVKLKLVELHKKIKKWRNILQSSQMNDKIRVLYDNIYIQTEYLRKLMETSLELFDKHHLQKDYSNQENKFQRLKQNRIKNLKELSLSISELKIELRTIYFQHIRKRKAKDIKDHSKLQHHICGQISVSRQEYQKNGTSMSFANGFIFAVLLVSLIGIIIFRQLNLAILEESSSYQIRFRIWRGASYLIYFNWVIAIVLYILNKWKINYRLILMDGDTFIPKHQRFFTTASILSAIYLIFFAIYLLAELKIIDGPVLTELGYLMWIINLVFLLIPAKILNYEGRRYFLKMFWKTICTLFRPMDMNIFFLAIVIGSFVQPFSDFAFTLCQAVHRQQGDCLVETRNATFIFTMCFLIYRFMQSIRSHRQFGEGKRFSRPLLGLIAVSFSANAVISSLLYNIYQSRWIEIYWLVSASVSTCTGINADLRADWGLISFDKEDCMLRKYKLWPRKLYFFIAGIDIVLNVGWVLTISNNTASDIGISPLYFFMVLTYIQLARKGLWMIFRLEEDHSFNIGNFIAVKDDSFLYLQLQESKGSNQMSRQNIYNESIEIFEVVLKTNISSSFKLMSSSNEIGQVLQISEMQKLVLEKKDRVRSIQLLLEELRAYLNIIHSIYVKLDWQDKY